MSKYVVLRGEAAKVAERLEAISSFPADMLDRLLWVTTKDHSELIETVITEITNITGQNVDPRFAGYVFAKQVAVALGWAEPEKLGPAKGVGSEDQMEWSARDPVGYRQWLDEMAKVLNAPVTWNRSSVSSP